MPRAAEETWHIISQWVWNEAPGAGLSACSRAGAHHRVCSCSLTYAQRGDQLAFPFTGLWVGRSGPALESGPLLGARGGLSSPMARYAVPASQSLVAHERRTEADGSLRVVYAASIRNCRHYPLREQWQWHGRAATKPRRVSVRLAPAPHRFCAPALEGLEPEAPSTRAHAAPARPTPRSAGPTDPLCQPGCLTCDPFPCAAGATLDSRGKSAWLAMGVPSRLA